MKAWIVEICFLPDVGDVTLIILRGFVFELCICIIPHFFKQREILSANISYAVFELSLQKKKKTATSS